MAKLIYSAITSHDGYVEDKRGNFDWAMPDAQAHAFIKGQAGQRRRHGRARAGHGRGRR